MQRLRADQLPDDAVLVDIRDELETSAQPLAALVGLPVVHLPLADLEAGAMPDVEADRALVVVCAVGVQSELAGAYLEAGGARRVALLEGGVGALRRQAAAEVTLELRLDVSGAVQALEAKRQLEAVPGVHLAGVAPDGLAVVRGSVTLEGLRAALPNLKIGVDS